jgi:hypothetical protein
MLRPPLSKDEWIRVLYDDPPLAEGNPGYNIDIFLTQENPLMYEYGNLQYREQINLIVLCIMLLHINLSVAYSL